MKMKQIFTRGSGVKSLYALLMILAMAAVLLLNIVATALTARYPLKIDLTANQLFALSQPTREAIGGIDGPVTIQVLATEERFASTSAYNAQANEVMRQFSQFSGGIALQYIDYVKNPTFAAAYPDQSIKHGDILVTGPARHKLVKTEELFQYTQTPTGQLAIVASQAEQAILSAVLYVTSDDLPVVAVATGHNEADTAAFAELLAQNNFEVQTVQLATQDIPPEVDILLLAAPKTDLTEEELKKLDRFLQNGGSYQKTLFYCADAEQPPLPGIEAFLAEWGAVPTDGAVFETDESRVYNYHPFYAVADYVNRDYAAMLRSDKVPLLAPISRPLRVLFAHQDRYSTDVLLQFGPGAGVRPSSAGEGFTADDATQRGPIPALVRCDYTLRQSGNANAVAARSTVLVSGSAEMLQGYAVGSSAFSNAQYLINLLSDLTQREAPLAVTPKTMAGSSLNITQQQADRLGTLFILIIPAVTLALGLAGWLTRRHK